MDIECLQDFALSEGLCCSCHSAGRAWQAGILLESTTAKPLAHIDFVMTSESKYTEKANNRYTNDRCNDPLAP